MANSSTLGNFRIGICFQKIGGAVSCKAEVDSRVAVEFERAINPLRQTLDARGQFRRKVLGRAVQDAAALLVVGIVLDLFGGDQPIALRHILKLQFPDRQHQQALIADNADVDFAAFNILLGDRRRADALVDELDAFGELLVAIDDGRL